MASTTCRRQGRFMVMEEDGPYRYEWAELSAVRQRINAVRPLEQTGRTKGGLINNCWAKMVDPPVTQPGIVPSIGSAARV